MEKKQICRKMCHPSISKARMNELMGDPLRRSTFKCQEIELNRGKHGSKEEVYLIETVRSLFLAFFTFHREIYCFSFVDDSYVS